MHFLTLTYYPRLVQVRFIPIVLETVTLLVVALVNLLLSAIESLNLKERALENERDYSQI